MKRRSFIFAVLVLCGCNGGGTGGSTQGVGVRIEVYDDTANKPLHEEAMIVAGSETRLLLQDAISDREYRGRIVSAPPYYRAEVSIFPDGPSGKEIVVPTMMTRDMATSSEPGIMIEITDAEVIASGTAVLEVTSDVVTYDRFE